MTWALAMPHRGQTTVVTRFAMRTLLMNLDDGPRPKDSVKDFLHKPCERDIHDAHAPSLTPPLHQDRSLVGAFDDGALAWGA